MAADLERVLEAVGRQQSGDRSLALDQRVDRNRAAVNEAVDLGRLQAGRRERALDAVANTLDRTAAQIDRAAAIVSGK